MSTTQPTANSRIDYLDSIRGIAAMMVVIYHFIGWKWADNMSYKVASLVFNGSEAISFFFVLSGFVLSFKYLHSDKKIDFGYYTYKRILRLYPAFILTVLINFAYWNRGLLLDGQILEVLKSLFYENPNKIWEELVMVRKAHKYYIPGWTLGVEMALSLLMPIFIIVARIRLKAILWFIPITIFLGFYNSNYVFHFLLGLVIAKYYYVIKSEEFKETKFYAYRYLWLFLGFVLYSLRIFNRMVDFGEGFHGMMKFMNIDFFNFSAIGGTIILVYVISNAKVQKLLLGKIWLFLGKISYSIYLCHWVLVVHVMGYWETYISYFENFQVGFVTILIGYMLATILFSTLMYHFVEEPFIKYAKKKKRFRYI